MTFFVCFYELLGDDGDDDLIHRLLCYTLGLGEAYLTYVFSIHVIEETEAVGWRVGDAVRVFGCYVEKRAYKSRLVSFLPWPRCLDVHVESLNNRDT